MTVSWGTIKSVLFFLGPLLIPKAWQYYRSVQAAPAIHGIPVRPIPPKVQRALFILFVIALAFFLRTFSTPENVFSRTSSRLQIPTDVLFTRLSALRPAGLTAADEILRGKLNSLESRLLFFQFGPDVITECGFCNAEDPKGYLYYSIPSIAAPYLFNLCVLAVVTSGLFTGKEGAIWRTTATIAGVAIAALELYLVSSYHYQGNSRATRLEDIDPFFWKMRIYRYLMIAAVDGVIGWMLYLSSTNRAFVTLPSTSERLETSTRLIAAASGKMQALAVARNSICRDPELNNQSRNYWVHEGMIMGEVMAEREVVDSRNNALRDRIDMQRVRIDAAAFADQIVGPLPGTPGI